MKKNTYRRIEAAAKLIQIIECLHQQTEPVSAGYVAEEIGLPVGTVQCYLATGMDAKWIKQIGTDYEPGPRLAGMWAAYCLGLEAKRDGINTELQSLRIEP